MRKIIILIILINISLWVWSNFTSSILNSISSPIGSYKIYVDKLPEEETDLLDLIVESASQKLRQQIVIGTPQNISSAGIIKAYFPIRNDKLNSFLSKIKFNLDLPRYLYIDTKDIQNLVVLFFMIIMSMD